MQKIQLKEKEYPCRVTMGAMVRFKHESGQDIREVNQDDVEQMLKFVWCCVKSASNADGVEFSIPFETFVDMIEPDKFSGFFGEMEGEEKKSVKAGRK